MSLIVNSSKDISYDALLLLDTNDVLQNALDLFLTFSSGGGGGITTSTATLPLSVTNVSATNKKLTIDLSNCSTTTAITHLLANKISTTHASYKIGNRDVDLCSYNVNVATIALTNSYGNIASLSVDVTGNLYKGSDAIITAPLLNSWSPTTLKLTDNNGTIRNLTPSISGNLLWNNSLLATITDLSNYILTTHESYKVGSNSVDFGAYNITSNSLTLQNLNSILGVARCDVNGKLTWAGDIMASIPDLLILQLGGVTQTATTLNIIQNNASLSGGVLNIESLWKPSAVTVYSGLHALSDDTLGTLSLSLTGAESRRTLKLLDSSGTVRDLTSNVTGGLVWNTAQLATETFVKSHVATNVYAVVNGGLTSLGFGSTGVVEFSVDSGLVAFRSWVSTEITNNAYTHPSSHPISMITGLQARLDTIDQLQDSIGLSLGIDNGSTGYDRCRMAIYEDNLTTHHHWYGMALYVSGGVVGMGLWGSSGVAVIDQGSGTGTLPHMMIKNGGNVGINQTNPQYTLDVTGDIRATGTVHGSSKQFDIEHPDPDKKIHID